MKGWTPEDIRNAETYGVCQTCGTPREFQRGQRSEGGKTVVWSGIVYPCGHAGYENLLDVGVDFTKSVRTPSGEKP